MDERPGTSDRDESPLVAASPLAIEPAIANAAAAAIAASSKTSWEQFVWQDSDPDVVPSSDTITATSDGVMPGDDMPADQVASADEGGHHAAVAPPIATTSPPPLPLDADERHELWRRQLLSALKDVDDNSPIPPPNRGSATSQPPAVYAQSTRRASGQQRAPLDQPFADTPSSSAVRRIAGRAAVIAAVVVCIFSTGALWATFRPASTTDTKSLTAATAAIHQVPVPADESDTRPMVNKPVLVRESEAPLPAPHVEMPPVAPRAELAPSPPGADAVPATPAANNSTWRQPPAAPSPPPIQVTPRSTPLIINRPVTAFTVPAAPAEEEHRRTEATTVEPPSTTLPRAAAAPSPRERRAVSETGPARTASAGAAARVSSEAYRSSGREASHAQAAPRPKWDNRRQGLRTAPQPEPEPSTLKKLLNAVWPASSGNKGPPVRSAPSTEPAPPVQPHNWSDLASPDP